MQGKIENISQAKNFVFSTTYKGSSLGLERIRDLLARLGNPQDKLKFIHISGTNGKGSTAAMLSSILVEAGYKTGLFTSPYIDCFTEMIQIDHRPISDDHLIALTNEMQAHLKTMKDKPTEFEIITALAFLNFYRQNCDIVVLEVGMGGRLDSTCVINSPEVAVITNIGMDHMEFLGDTIEEIAADEAGIIKTGTVCISYPQIESVEQVIRHKCLEQGVKVVFADKIDAEEYTIPFLGQHQLVNASVAINTINALRDQEWVIPEESLKQGLAKTKWPGRFEIMRHDPVFIIDGAHNLQSVEMTANTLISLYPGKKITFLIGLLADKDYENIIKTLMPLAKEFLTVTPDSPRALPAEVLAEHINDMGSTASSYNSIEEGVKQALAASNKDDIICAVGSLHLIGRARKALGPVPTNENAYLRPIFPPLCVTSS